MRRVLHEAAASLLKGGRLLIDQINRFFLLREQSPTYEIVQRNNNLRIGMINNDTDRLSTLRKDRRPQWMR
ncbi:hypothetical protein MesoLj113b_68270 (plasmid) [Mesorhizobium sp. 113-3-3]|nr:hypothetical protein MesoLj113b_68270 [Mesorhizobium sp. 113-3-3]